MSTSNYADSSRTLTGSLAAVRTATETVAPKDLAGGDEYERRIDEENLPEEYQAALAADDFILYGKASIEQFDRGNAAEGQPPQKLEMGALEDALDTYLAQGKAGGPVSYDHDDVIVGDVIESFELDDLTEVEVGDETLQFDAGDTLTTHVEDADGDGRPEFWAVANLANDTYFARKMRLLTMAGALDGFSVTVVPREWEETDAGQRVTELDWHSTTIGTDDQILNPGSEFGVAAFKLAMSDAKDGMAATFRSALTGASDAGGEPAETPRDTANHDDITETLHMGFIDNLFSASGIDPDLGRAASEATQKAQDHDLSQKEAVTLTVNSDEFGDNDDVTEQRLLDAMDDVDADVDVTTDDADGGATDDVAEAAADDEGPPNGADAGADVDEHADGDDDGGQDDAHDAAARLASAIDGADAADVMAAVESLGEDSEPKADDEHDDEEDDDEDDAPEPEQHADADAGEFVTEDELDEKLSDTRENIVGDVVDELAPKLEGAVDDAVEDIGQHAMTGGTSDPSGGPAETGRDLDAELERIEDEARGGA